MSRHTKKIGKITYAWGYDPQMSEYFFQKFNLDLVSESNDEGIEFSIGTLVTIVPRKSELLVRPPKIHPIIMKDIMVEEMTLMEKKFIPKDHLDLMLAGLPF